MPLAPVRFDVAAGGLHRPATWALLCGAVAGGWQPHADHGLRLILIWFAVVALLLPLAVAAAGRRGAAPPTMLLPDTPHAGGGSPAHAHAQPAAGAGGDNGIEAVLLGEPWPGGPPRQGSASAGRAGPSRRLNRPDRSETANLALSVVLSVSLLAIAAPALVLPALVALSVVALADRAWTGGGWRGGLDREGARGRTGTLTPPLVSLFGPALAGLAGWLAFGGANAVPAPVAVTEGLSGGMRWWLGANAAWPLILTACFVLARLGGAARDQGASADGAARRSAGRGRLVLGSAAYAVLGLVVAWHEQALAFGAVALIAALQWPMWRQERVADSPGEPAYTQNLSAYHLDAYGMAAMLIAAWAVRPLA